MYYLRFFTLSLIISLFALKGFSQADGFFGGNEMDFLMSKKPAKLIIFTADWCGPCKAAKKAMKEHVDAHIVKIIVYNNFMISPCCYC